MTCGLSYLSITPKNMIIVNDLRLFSLIWQVWSRLWDVGYIFVYENISLLQIIFGQVDQISTMLLRTGAPRNTLSVDGNSKIMHCRVLLVLSQIQFYFHFIPLLTVDTPCFTPVVRITYSIFSSAHTPTAPRLEDYKSSYLDYLQQARVMISSCAQSCTNWCYSYDGEIPPHNAAIETVHSVNRSVLYVVSAEDLVLYRRY